MTTHQLPTKTTSVDDLDDFMAELERDLARDKAKAKSEPRAKPMQAWQNLPVVQPVWFPHAIVLIVNTQRCKCGCSAQSVEGLFLESVTKNGTSKQVRVDRSGIPADFNGKPRQLREVTQDIEMCPACFNAGVVTTNPPDDLDQALENL